MSISAQLSTIAKYIFPTDVPHAFYNKNPGLGDAVKKTDAAKGESYKISVAYSQGAAGSATYSDAYAIAGNARYERFSVTSVTDYAIARMNGEDIEKLSGDKGAVIDAWKDRIDSAYYEAMRSLAINWFGDGSGQRGIVSSGQATNTLVLGSAAATPEPSRITNFYVGMNVQAAQTATGALHNAGAVEVVAGIDRIGGTLTSTSAAWNTVIAALAAGDSLFRRGDAQDNSGVAKVITGMGQWIIGGSSPAPLFGATRTTDPVALAGQAASYATVDMVEAVLQHSQLVAIQEGDEDKTLYCNPRDKVNLVKLLEGRARYVRPEQKSDATVGVDTIEFETDSGPMKLKGDINVPVTQFFILATKLCELISVGPTPKPMEVDGQTVRARDQYDAYEMRIGSYVNAACRFPGACGRGTGWGT